MCPLLSFQVELKWHFCFKHCLTLSYFRRLLMELLTVLCPALAQRCWHLHWLVVCLCSPWCHSLVHSSHPSLVPVPACPFEACWSGHALPAGTFCFTLNKLHQASFNSPTTFHSEFFLMIVGDSQGWQSMNTFSFKSSSQSWHPAVRGMINGLMSL